ncbi:DUF5666 domain-containing protein [Variovorax guangxiensis]|uniref:DUF5666 domain-containing protein n=1 Tax=Variovorax guangxiensis TaxID=1775474 RepID=A0A502DK79_9BURK|nr:DUF5666 domain-containing protein [Variovorax guangxiensis]TPG21394.1 hypothetical protein EAH83_17610 [Variovorax ginsengisoli]TPG25444.1 hypothetical protein EAH82_18095 [Variovorax guangxiensis]
MKSFLLPGLLAMSTALVVSCGGGGGGGGGSSGDSGVNSAGQASSGALAFTSASAPDWGFAAQSVSDGGPGGSGSSAGTSGGSNGSSDGGGATASAGGVGSGGTGASASAGDTGGVGSGGTGASASAGDSGDSGVGGVGGVASIIVNGVRYNTDSAVLKLRDAPVLQLGMTAKVNGPTNADFTAGIATEVESAADARGTVVSVDVNSGNLVVLGTTINTDSTTVWGNISGLSAVTPGMTVQVWGLPAGAGMLRATRVEQQPASSPIITGTVQNLDSGNRRFVLGGLTVEFKQNAAPAALAAGVNVRVRGNVQPTSPVLQAATVELWYPVSLRDGTRRQLGGVVTDFVAARSFRVLGTPVDASSAQVSGGPLAAIANGVELDVAGTVANGVLVATKIKIKKTPGGASAASFTAMGTIGAFKSAADFKVKGQQVDASGPGVQFVNGTAANLGNGTKVSINGDRIVNDVLIATRVSFD